MEKTNPIWPPAWLARATFKYPILRPLRNVWVVVAALVTVVLAIALGVGLGVGLHKHKHPHSPQQPLAYCTDSTGSYKLTNITAPERLNSTAAAAANASSSVWRLTVDDTETGYKQNITGFGATVTDATVDSFNAQSNATQQSLLRQLVTSAGANFSVMRHSIGSSDLSSTAYTYDDNNGKADPDLSSFALGDQGTAMAQLLAQMKELNSDLQVMGSPWSPPGWMKLNGDLEGNITDNNLDDGYFTSKGVGSTGYSQAFAQYFVKYIQAYADLGVAIDAISIQNEPLNSQKGYPTMYVYSDEAGQLIRDYIGPALQNASLNTSIWALDDNTDDASYAETVLKYADEYIDAVAWHCYATELNWTVLTQFHNQYPNVSQYMSECWTPTNISWTHTVNFTMGPLQNWANGVMAWTLGTNDDDGPHLDGGCSSCAGVVTINSTANSTVSSNSDDDSDADYTYSTSYYLMVQFSRFIPPGARILQANGSSTDDNGDGIQTVASLNPDGSRTVVIENTFDNATNVTVSFASSGDVWMGSVPATSLTTWILP